MDYKGLQRIAKDYKALQTFHFASFDKFIEALKTLFETLKNFKMLYEALKMYKKSMKIKRVKRNFMWIIKDLYKVFDDQRIILKLLSVVTFIYTKVVYCRPIKYLDISHDTKWTERKQPNKQHYVTWHVPKNAAREHLDYFRCITFGWS